MGGLGAQARRPWLLFADRAGSSRRDVRADAGVGQRRSRYRGPPDRRV